MKKLIVQSLTVNIATQGIQDYISLTDIARVRNAAEPKDVVKNWLRTRATIEFLGLWETINNPSFKGVEFDSFKQQAGANSFTLSPTRWIEATNAIGLQSTAGRGGGTYAHQDIAFEFASWVSAEFKLYLIKEFQRLKQEESEKQALGWDIKRTLARINYKIHTDAIKQTLIPIALSAGQISAIYASEADILNLALFGQTAKQWRDSNPSRQGNMRDYASIEQLVVLSNLESLNAEFIRMSMPQTQRIQALNKAAIVQMQSLLGMNNAKAIAANLQIEAQSGKAIN
jgi:KilA-N domain